MGHVASRARRRLGKPSGATGANDFTAYLPGLILAVSKHGPTWRRSHLTLPSSRETSIDGGAAAFGCGDAESTGELSALDDGRLKAPAHPLAPRQRLPGDGVEDDGDGGDGGDWFKLTVLTAVAIFICYADRSNISTAIIPMAQQYGWDKVAQGGVLSAFFYGYALTQLVGGRLADRFGGKPVLTAGVLGWSLVRRLRLCVSRGERRVVGSCLPYLCYAVLWMK